MSGLWAAVGGVLGLILLAVWVISVADIVRSHLGRGQTAAWLLIVLLLPFVGSVLYWALRRPSAEEVQYRADSEQALRESARQRPFDHAGV
jgi:cbb3-type cytochrome oxidase subunit 3